MMRSLYSGVSGLRTHQTRMDVIGNNIANVNTTAYKAKNITFSDMLYQTTQSATGPNAANGTAGTNPRQIGLGVKTGAINTSITTEGATQSTGNPFDLKLTGEAFFVVSDGKNQYFTRDGSFNVDAAGYLCMGSTGYIVQGWTNTDAETGAIIQDSVKPIQVMSEKNATYPAAYTTKATISGIIDANDDNLMTENGKIMNIQTLDNRGYEYNLKFGIVPDVQPDNSTKNVTNTETLYKIPNTIYAVDTSELTFTYTDSAGETATLSQTDMPKDLLAALKKEASIFDANNSSLQSRTGNHVLGGKEDNSVSFAIDDEFINTYKSEFSKITELGDYSYLKDLTISVSYSGGLGYKSSLASDTKPIEMTDAVRDALFKTGTAGSSTYASYEIDNTKADITNGMLVTEKSYTEGDETKKEYVIQATDTGKKVLNLKYEDLKGLFRLGTNTIQGKYVTSESIEIEKPIEGQFKIRLLGMTDSEGVDVDISGLRDTEHKIYYDTSNGKFKYIDSEGTTAIVLNLSQLNNLGNFSDVSFDMSNTSNVDNGGKSNIEGLRDDGRKVGTLTGVAIGTDGVITANYSNGMSKSIAQIAVATFANAMGLQNEGDNLYSATANSGEFNGVGVDIKASGTGYMTTGVLEMSNVDLSQQFTDMITTQRGFQANSRIITTSDTLLEELVNLKR